MNVSQRTNIEKQTSEDGKRAFLCNARFANFCILIKTLSRSSECEDFSSSDEAIDSRQSPTCVGRCAVKIIRSSLALIFRYLSVSTGIWVMVDTRLKKEGVFRIRKFHRMPLGSPRSSRPSGQVIMAIRHRHKDGLGQKDMAPLWAMLITRKF